MDLHNLDLVQKTGFVHQVDHDDVTSDQRDGEERPLGFRDGLQDEIG